MATAACLLPSDEKSDNFRLLSLIIDGGTHVLRYRFDQAFPPSQLQNKLNDPNIRGKLNSLRTRKIINNEQWNLLFNNIYQPNSKNFDISLLACLLRYICGLDESAAAWSGIPPSFDISTEADISRLRQYRNKVSHAHTLMLPKQDFQRDWQEMEQVILRLGSGSPNLQQYIQTLKNSSLDPSKEKEYETTVKEWEKMDENIRYDIDAMKGHINHQGTCIEHLERKQELNASALDMVKLSLEDNAQKLSFIETKHKKVEKLTRKHQKVLTKSSFEQKRYIINARTNSFLSSQATSDQLYVTSTLHEGAKRKLNHNSFIVICGPPGEGKTTMAAKLMCEIAEPTSRFKLNDPGELELLFTRRSNQIVFIDDIFGEGLFSESLFNKWSTVLSEIKQLAKFLILTTRDYILEQAKNKMSMKYLNIFAEKHIHRLSSSALSISEKSQILRAHLRFAKIRCDRKIVEKCVGLYYTSALVGFPEICRLFANNHTLFIKGPSVFENPSHFFKNCIKDIFRDENTFIAMMLIWSRPNKSLNVLDVERKQYNILSVANAFGYELNNSSKLKVLKAMEFHKNGFLTYNQNTGDYTFCHTRVSDMVGLVAGQEHTGAILEYANEEFIMQYITTDANNNDDFHIFIEEFRFQQLNDNIRRCISITPYPMGRKQPQIVIDTRKTKVTLPKKVKLRQMPLFIGEDVLNAAIVKHDCFNNRKYIEQCLERSSFLSSPVISFRRQFGYYGIDVGDRFLTVNLPLRALLYDNIMLLDVFLKQKTFNYHMQSTKDFFYVGMLIAAHKGLVHAADLLLKHGGKVCEDAIFIAAENSDIRMLSYLLKHRGNDYSFDSNIMNKNSPLIAVAKRGLIPPMKCLLYHGVDINYRNANKASALEKAVLYQQRDACKFLLVNGADVNGKGGKYKRTPLHIAADIGTIEIVELLLQHGAGVKIKDCKGHFPIFCAAIQGHAETVDCMLKKDVSQASLRISSYGRKSLIKGMGLMHVAVWKNDTKLLAILLQNKVNPDSRDFYGRTPFYCAVDSGKTKIVDALSSVSNVKLAEKNGFTPLHMAIHRGHTHIAKQICLLSDINAQDKYGKTALHTACEELDSEMFHLLVMVCGADLRILTKTGKSIMNILHDTLLRPLLSKFMSPKKFKHMSAEGVRYGEQNLKTDENWEIFRGIVADKDPQFADTWIDVFARRNLQSK